jgi:hypothetical protein
VKDLLDRMARAGLLARGAVYLCIGLLAARAAAGLGGRTTDARGAVRTMGSAEPHGIVFALLALGLLGYGVWRLAAAVLDLERKGGGAKGLAVRAAYAGIGLTHLALAFTAAGLGLPLLGGSGGSSETIRHSVAAALDHPLGPWLVGGASLAVLGGGIYQFYRAYALTFEEHVEGSGMSRRARRFYRGLGRFGIAARGVTFVIIGLALLRAAQRASPREAKGLPEALRELQSIPHGDLWLGAVAFGLVAFGLMSVMEARYRQLGT